jgi:hypothetical protein
MRNWLKTLLFVSAFSPVLLTLAYVRYRLNGFQQDVVQLIIIGIIGTIVPFLIMKLICKSSETLAFSAKKIESNDFMLFAFVSSYLTPIIARASDLQFDWIVILTFFIVFIFWFISSVPAHPLLKVLSFNFYKIESSSGVVYTLISKRKIRDPKNVVFVKKISDDMLMEISE